MEKKPTIVPTIASGAELLAERARVDADLNRQAAERLAGISEISRRADSPDTTPIKPEAK